MHALAWLVIASGSNTVALLGALIPVVVILLISAVPIYFRLSERHRRRQAGAETQKDGGQHDLAAEVEEMRRKQAEE
jgi:hypothetical protein